MKDKIIYEIKALAAIGAFVVASFCFLMLLVEFRISC